MKNSHCILDIVKRLQLQQEKAFMGILCEKEQCGRDDKFVHLSDKYLSGACSIPGSVLSAGGTLMSPRLKL